MELLYYTYSAETLHEYTDIASATYGQGLTCTCRLLFCSIVSGSHIGYSVCVISCLHIRSVYIRTSENRKFRAIYNPRLSVLSQRISDRTLEPTVLHKLRSHAPPWSGALTFKPELKHIVIGTHNGQKISSLNLFEAVMLEQMDALTTLGELVSFHSCNI